MRRVERDLREAAWMPPRLVAVVAFALLVTAFVIDAVTPAGLVIAILLDIPIVLAALTQSRRLTVSLVLAAVLADVSAAVINAARDGYRWEPIWVGDRALSLLSIVLVGYLSIAVQERAQRVGRLAAQERLATELADRNRALSERQDVIRDLVFALSHDLRTPLAALATTLRQAADGAYGSLPPRYEAVLRDSLVSIDDLRRLAETLLLVARFESGERRSETERVDVAAVAAEVASELRAMAEARRIALRVRRDGAATVRASRADLKRAVANLVANSLAHTPGGGTVDIAVERAPDEAIRLVVADDGYGVPEALRGALFQRFSTAARAGGGTGLGLYIVRRIAEESAGTVSYAPREPRGSVFTLALPSAPP